MIFLSLPLHVHFPEQSVKLSSGCGVTWGHKIGEEFLSRETPAIIHFEQKVAAADHVKTSQEILYLALPDRLAAPCRPVYNLSNGI